VAFFYTRCMNPAKCSLTVTRLAAVAAYLTPGGGGDVNVLAVSYDGDFDTAPRLREFGAARGFGFSETARLARVATGWPAVRRQFALQVGYGDVTVNAHAREVFAVSPGLAARGLEAEALADPVAALAVLKTEAEPR
jgi:protein SCO1/2